MSNCPGCNKPMVDGQVFNGLLKCHWDCQDIVREQMGENDSLRLMKERASERMLRDGITPVHPLWAKLLDELEKEWVK